MDWISARKTDRAVHEGVKRTASIILSRNDVLRQEEQKNDDAQHLSTTTGGRDNERKTSRVEWSSVVPGGWEKNDVRRVRNSLCMGVCRHSRHCLALLALILDAS